MLIGLTIIVGFVVLVFSSDLFVKGAAAIAQNFGVSPSLVGLTIVSIGTSSPEILVSFSAAITGAGELAIGNAVGSNIANIGLVLGATLCLCSIRVARVYLQLEIPILLSITALAAVLIIDLELSSTDSLLMLTALLLAMYIIVKKRLVYNSSKPNAHNNNIEELSRLKASIFFLIGLVLLIVSSRLLVWGATEAAMLLGVSELVIGLTIVAVGTSLPELAASIASALKNHPDLAFGNVIGSNIFNLLAVMPIPGLIQSLSLNRDFLYRDFFTMSLLTLILSGFVYASSTKLNANCSVVLGRKIGSIFVGAYVLYYYYLYISM